MALKTQRATYTHLVTHIKAMFALEENMQTQEKMSLTHTTDKG